jgi:hypothetical protein
MMKYAIITKCEPHNLYKIFFEIYKNHADRETMMREEFDHFVQSNH